MTVCPLSRVFECPSLSNANLSLSPFVRAPISAPDTSRLVRNKIKVDIFDPLINSKDIYKEYKIKLLKKIKINYYDFVLIAVAHNEIKKMGINKIKSYLKKDSYLMDLKYIYGTQNIYKK